MMKNCLFLIAMGLKRNLNFITPHVNVLKKIGKHEAFGIELNEASNI